MLNALDLYDVTLYTLRGVECKEVAQTGNVYAEDLQRVFTWMTGLDTHL